MTETNTPQTDFLILLHTVARLMRTHADQLARLKGMTRAQWGILGWLNHQPGISQNDLASLVEVEPITVGRMIDRLEGRGLVERRADPKDRRIRRLHLTDLAIPLLAEMHEWKAAMAEVVTAGIDPEILKVAEQALVQMKTNLTNERRDNGKSGAGPTMSQRFAESGPADNSPAEPDISAPRLVSAK